MSEPVLNNSGTAKSAFKANLSKQGRFSLIITGWQAADKSFLSDVTELRLVVSSDGVLSCDEPACGAESRSFCLTPTTRSLFLCAQTRGLFPPSSETNATHIRARWRESHWDSRSTHHQRVAVFVISASL